MFESSSNIRDRSNQYYRWGVVPIINHEWRTWDDLRWPVFPWRLKQKLEWNLQTSQLLFDLFESIVFLLQINWWIVLEVSSPDVFKKNKALVLFSPQKSAGNIFFQLNLYRCFFVVPHHENSILWFNDFYQRRVSCRTTVGMFLGGASRGDDFFFLGGNFPRLFTFRCILHKNTCDIRI